MFHQLRVSAAFSALAATIVIALLTAAPAAAQTQIAPTGGAYQRDFFTSSQLGQTFTVPAGQTRIANLSMAVARNGAPATFRLQLRSISGSTLGAPIVTSGNYTTVENAGSSTVRTSYSPNGGVAVTAGQTYAIMAVSINGSLALPASDNVYSGGSFYDGSLQTFYETYFSVTFAEAPTITAIAPSAGPTLGGTSVVITGTNLASATAVTFGGTAAGIISNSATSITVTSPARAAGPADIVVTTVGGTSANTAADDFTYVTPAPVPTVSEWAMILLGLLLAGAATIIVQRRGVAA